MVDESINREAQYELDQARVLLGSPLIYCRISAHGKKHHWLQSGDRSFITARDFHDIRMEFGTSQKLSSAAVQLAGERAAFSIDLYTRSGQAEVRLIAVEPKILPEDVAAYDELGAILPWAERLVRPEMSDEAFFREALASLSPRAFLSTICLRTGARAAVLWAVMTSERARHFRVVESWGVSAQLSNLRIPIDRGVLGFKSLDAIAPRQVDTKSSYSYSITRAEGWKSGLACGVNGGGQLLGALSLYGELDALDKDYPYDLLLVNSIPFIRRFKRIQERTTLNQNIESRLERLQVGLELLGFAHDLAESAHNAADRARELSGILASRSLPAETKPLVVELQHEADVVSRISRSMNRLARGRKTERTSFDVLEEVLDIETILYTMSEGVHIKIPKGIEIKGNPLDFQRIIINLVSNARYWTTADAADIRVTGSVIQGDRGQEIARIEIRDNGRGMSPEETRRATTMLYTTRRNGLGLGLFVVKRLVERLHGELTIRSILYVGTTVVIELPVAR